LAIRLFLSSLSSLLVAVAVSPLNLRHREFSGLQIVHDQIVLGIAISVDVDFISILI
jgi:flagellar biosynthesis protein FliR